MNKKKTYFKLEKYIFTFELFILNISFTLLILGTLAQIFSRIFNIILSSIYEFSLLQIFIITFVGIGATIYTENELSIELLNQTNRYYKVQKIFINLITIIFLSIISYFYVDFFFFIKQEKDMNITLGIPTYYYSIISIIGVLLGFIHSIGNILRYLDIRK